jgi:hypothetical protein
MKRIGIERTDIRVIVAFICFSVLFAFSNDPREAGPPNQVTVPGATISLFNGKDLSSFYTWLPKYGHKDPDKVFTVVNDVDGAPAIRISGQHYGGLITRKEYSNYKLVAEFRWGSKTWEPECKQRLYLAVASFSGVPDHRRRNRRYYPCGGIRSPV